MSARRLGVTQRVVIDPRFGERRDALDQRWPRFLVAAGYLPVALPNDAATAVHVAAAMALSGLLLTGGNDLADYGGDAPERDAAEAALLAWARHRGLPVLGVCRGMQVIQHGFGVPLVRGAGHAGTRHRIGLDGGSREVNSYHHLMSFDTVPALTVTARADDGAVEAVRHRDEPVAGIGWHPEREPEPDDRDVMLFHELFGGTR